MYIRGWCVCGVCNYVFSGVLWLVFFYLRKRVCQVRVGAMMVCPSVKSFIYVHPHLPSFRLPPTQTHTSTQTQNKPNQAGGGLGPRESAPEQALPSPRAVAVVWMDLRGGVPLQVRL
jgi:hypothetical protein